MKLKDAQISGFVRLFEYIKEVSKEIGEGNALKILESIVVRKRLRWLKRNVKKFKRSSLEDAFKIFYFKYLGLSLRDVKIVEKSENKILSRWKNFCPVLEACKILGLDTRKICKKVYERPTQIFFKKINPSLKFRRNYEKIRPYAKYCEEVLEMVK